MTFEFWFMFPTAILIATIAMASGVEGATFFAPIFLLALGLPAEVAIGTGLITEVFGFASGVGAYVKRRLIDYRLATSLLIVTIPAAIAGSLVVHYINDAVIESVLGMGLVAVAISFLGGPDHDEIARLDAAVRADHGGESAERCIRTAAGEEIRYTVCNRTEGRLISGVGALFMGMVSTGLGEMNGYFLLRRCRVPSAIAVGTSVLIVAVTVLSAAGVHLWRFVQTGGDALPTVASLVIFTIPGVLIGGQIGPKVAAVIPGKILERALGVIFLLVGALMIGKVALT
ncbi:MAG: sulfite exporter TauE/SafE family protein [Longimicrobiales bacterium]|nr:sulfite exporter TauE/SafE family protein [Longimicrobiales bacterium]